MRSHVELRDIVKNSCKSVAIGYWKYKKGCRRNIKIKNNYKMIVKNASLQERFLLGNVTRMALKWFESWKRRRCTKQIAARVSRPFLPLGRQISVSTDGEQTCSFYERENMRRELQFASENSIFSDKTYENLALRQLPNTENSGKNGKHWKRCVKNDPQNSQSSQIVGNNTTDRESWLVPSTMKNHPLFRRT